MKQNWKEVVQQVGIVPVVVIEQLETAVPLVQALHAGGVPIAEITLRTEVGLRALEQVAHTQPDILVGAGSVTTLEQCKQVVEAGAQFVVSPGFNPALVTFCLEREIPVLPGCVTPTELMQAQELGLDVVKFFPASLYGGISGMRALRGPFPKMRFIPTGGIDQNNLVDYLQQDFVLAAGGSWLCPTQALRGGDYPRIQELAHASRLRASEAGRMGLS